MKKKVTLSFPVLRMENNISPNNTKVRFIKQCLKIRWWAILSVMLQWLACIQAIVHFSFCFLRTTKLAIQVNPPKGLFMNYGLVLTFAIASLSLQAQAPFITTWKTNTSFGCNTCVKIPTKGGGYNYDVDWENDGTYDDFGVTGSITHDYGTAGTYTVAIKGAFPRIYFGGFLDVGFTTKQKLKLRTIEQWGDIAWSSMQHAFNGAVNLTYNATDVPDLSNVINMGDMFHSAHSFNGDIGNWDVSNVKNMFKMFKSARSFNQDIGNWDVSKATNMVGMFASAGSFNQNIGNWDVSNVHDMNHMFEGAGSFNHNIGNWDVGNVDNMVGMFASAGSFNQDIGNWDVSNVTTMKSMFHNATSFNQNLGNWNITKVSHMNGMLSQCGMNRDNYDNTLLSWAFRPVKLNVSLGASGRIYCFGEIARDVLIRAPLNWNISGDAKQCACPDADEDGFESALCGGTDCDDNDPNEFPNQIWYIDADHDDYGSSMVTACKRPQNGKVLSELATGSTGLDDCDDGEASTHPGAEEICGDNIDNNCNNETDEGCCALPDAICQAFTAQLDPTGNVTITPSDVDGGSTADCGQQSLVIDVSDFNCTHIGNSQTVTLTITDVNGDSDDCTAIVTVEDNILPTANCQPHTVQLGANGNGFITAADVDNGSTDACGIASLAVSPSSFACVPTGVGMGANTVTLTVTDNNGNVKTCDATVTVEDNVPPAANCKAHTVQLDANGNSNITAADVDDNSSDACGIAPPSVSPSSFACANIGANTVTLTVTDNNGNVKTCNATVTVEDNVKPTANCQPHTVQLDANGNSNITAADVDDNSSDACGIAPPSVSPSSFACANIGANTVTLTVTDVNGNPATCTATVTVEDNVPPSANCKAHTVQLDANGNGSITAADVDDSSSDACGIASLAVSPSSFACVPTGVGMEANTVTLTVTDNNGNVKTCTATVTVEDNIAPSANCQDVTISLDNDGNYSLAPPEVFLSGSDNCGTVNPASVSPNAFTCLDEGSNNVTLTVDDGNDNTATCTATVTVNEFLSPPSVLATDETCAGASDGSITVSATAQAGQVGYSIDGGVNFQFTGSFTPLPPGTYNVVVKVFGVAATCVKTATATVGAGSAETTWYKDLDADGYTDGITQSSCTQPMGYVTNALPGDCNDNDPDAFPGQVWHKDSDDDGYSDGSTQTACLRPASHKTAAELVGTDIDCNDSDPAVNPGATEVCNGIDDNCNGDVDEGTSGGLTWTGNVAFYTQADVDNFSQCYSIIDGNLTITGAGITDLSNLTGLVEVTGSVTIQVTGLASLAGLDNLEDIGGTLTIYFNSTLTSLNGLDALASVGGSLMMYYNFNIEDCCAIHSLLSNGGVAGTVFIFYNKTGCNSEPEIVAGCVPPSALLTTSGNGGQAAPFVSQSIGKQGVGVYPNPASSMVNIYFEKSFESGQLRLSDLQGRVLYQTKLTPEDQTEQLDVSGYNSGLYLLTLKTDDEFFTIRLIVD